MKMLIAIPIVVGVLTSALIAGCGPELEPTGPQVGVLVDAAVMGVDYNTDNFSGRTNAEGEFDYIAGNYITFSIGEITFPTVKAASEMTPLELAGTEIVSDSTALDIARFLQSVDKDGNPGNGIEITQAMHDAALIDIDFTVSQERFEQNRDLLDYLSSIGRTLVGANQAKAHLEETLSTLAEGDTYQVLINSGIIPEPTELTGGLGYTSEELLRGIGCHSASTVLYGELAFFTACLDPNGTGVLTIETFDQRFDSTGNWSVDRRGALAYRLEDTQGGLWTGSILRLADGQLLVEVNDLPLNYQGLPPELNAKMLGTIE